MGKITGKTQLIDESGVSKVIAPCLMFLIDRKSQTVIATVKTDHLGHYQFTGIDPDGDYLLVGVDLNGVYAPSATKNLQVTT